MFGVHCLGGVALEHWRSASEELDALKAEIRSAFPRTGDAFATLRRRQPHTVDRRTVVVVVSDGLDVGDQDTLADSITWLAERAGAVVWLNPLAVSPKYKPESRGMATSLPYLDALFGFAEPADLAEAARQLEHRGLSGSVGYEYDPRRADSGGDSA